MNFKKFIIASLLLGIITGTAACGKTADIKTVKIAYLPITHALPVFVENELQDKTGQKYKIELVKYGSWPELMDALNTGHIDGASVLIELAMKAKEQGVGVKAVALGHKDGNVIVVSPNIKTASDLKGKKFAIPHRQSSHNILLGQMLQNAGLSYKDVDIVELPPPEMPSALAQGQIAGYCVAEPFGAKSVALEAGKVLFESNELWKNSICCSLVLSDKFISSNRDAAKEVVSKYREAGEYIDSHKGEANTFAKKYLNLDDKVLDLSMKWISYNDLEITKEAYDSLTSKIKEFGISSNPPTYDDFVDSSLSKK
ncbi:ABC transporter substrate-binding protein [Ruminiclostridium josui]|uniref:ABC transporter substrate-binding protein n=1 Tax=Ruminiclostridium josui TaxID=1499 RepID=UPI000467AF64|nr:ABC transporter substrate-binding protein [Ruminiclostridium josui]